MGCTVFLRGSEQRVQESQHCNIFPSVKQIRACAVDYTSDS